MRDKAEAMVWASLCADSLALGAHWIYDTDRLAREFGRVETLRKPWSGSHHKGKERGEFTHYGDQTMVLLESVAARGGFDAADFSVRWRELFRDYGGYLDKATLGTLENIRQGASPEEAGSGSEDLAGASRLAPLALFYRNDPDALAAAARAQTAMTHNVPEVIEAAEFFGRLTLTVLSGSPVIEAIEATAEERLTLPSLKEFVRAGLASRDRGTLGAITEFGQACPIRKSFPSVIHLLAKYENDLKEALVQSTMAGGDSAARGMMVGLVLGAKNGLEAVPREWAEALVQKERIAELIGRIP